MPAGSFPAGHILEVRSAGAASVQAMLVDYDREHPISGDWYSDDRHFFDTSFSTRPPGARGYFAEAFRTSRPLGKIFFAPAGHPYHGEGGQGRQKSLGLFIRAQHVSDDDGDFGEQLIPVLHNCLRLESDIVRDLLVRIGREVAATPPAKLRPTRSQRSPRQRVKAISINSPLNLRWSYIARRQARPNAVTATAVFGNLSCHGPS